MNEKKEEEVFEVNELEVKEQVDEEVLESVHEDETLEQQDDDIKEDKTKKSRKKKVIAIVCFAIVLIAILGIIIANSNKYNMVDCFDETSAQEFMVEGLVCFAPKEWEVGEALEEDDYIEVSAKHYSEEDSSADATFSVRYYGQFDSYEEALENLVETFSNETIIEEHFTKVSVPGCTEAYGCDYLTYNINANEENEACARIIYCKESLFLLFGYAPRKVIVDEEFIEMFDACDTENYIVKEIESISAECNFTPVGGGYVSEDSDITVTAHYNTGETEEVEDWETDDSLILIVYGENKMKITYEGKSCILDIECTESKSVDEYSEVPDFWCFNENVRYDASKSELLESVLSSTGASEAYYYTIPSNRVKTAIANYKRALVDNGFSKLSEEGAVTNYINRDARLGVMISSEKNTNDSSLYVVNIVVFEL